MKKLSREQMKEYADLNARLHDAYARLDAPIARFNEAVAKAYAELQLQPEVVHLNETVEAVNSFIETVHADQQDYYDERSEGWQDGDAGSTYDDWMSAWELEVGEVEFEEPVPMEPPYFEGLELFEAIDTEVSS
jgi:hypothetical protein